MSDQDQLEFLTPPEGARPIFNPAYPVIDLPEYPEKANKSLIDSIRVNGVLSPIWVYEEKTEAVRITVAGGRRRLHAVRKLGRDTIPALIFRKADGFQYSQVLTLAENNLRSDSPASELEAVEGLANLGFSERQIADQNNISITRVRKLLELRDLPAPLLEGFKRGNIAKTVAAKAAKQPEAVQTKLVAVYEESGKLRGKDVDQAGKVHEQQQIDMWPDLDIGDAPDRAAIPYETVMETLNRLEGLIGTNADATLLLAVIQEMKAEL